MLGKREAQPSAGWPPAAIDNWPTNKKDKRIPTIPAESNDETDEFINIVDVDDDISPKDDHDLTTVSSSRNAGYSHQPNMAKNACNVASTNRSNTSLTCSETQNQTLGPVDSNSYQQLPLTNNYYSAGTGDFGRMPHSYSQSYSNLPLKKSLLFRGGGEAYQNQRQPPKYDHAMEEKALDLSLKSRKPATDFPSPTEEQDALAAQSRPSVICSKDNNSPNARSSNPHCAVLGEVAEVDEHFRKSLAATTLENSTTTEADVDHHFARALGETWLKLKAPLGVQPETKSS